MQTTFAFIGAALSTVVAFGIGAVAGCVLTFLFSRKNPAVVAKANAVVSAVTK